MGVTPPKAVLFDWDNTLVNTWPIIHQALHDTFVHYDMEPWPFEIVKQRVARSMRDAFPDLFGDDWEEAALNYQANYRKYHLQQLEPLGEVVALLDALQRAGIPVGVVSNKKNTNLAIELDHLGWHDYFQVTVGSGDAEHDKPRPEPIWYALEKMELEPDASVWFVGDSHVDLEAAQAAGVTPVLFGEIHADLHDPSRRTYHGFPYHSYTGDHRTLQELLKL